MGCGTSVPAAYSDVELRSTGAERCDWLRATVEDQQGGDGRLFWARLTDAVDRKVRYKMSKVEARSELGGTTQADLLDLASELGKDSAEWAEWGPVEYMGDGWWKSAPYTWPLGLSVSVELDGVARLFDPQELPLEQYPDSVLLQLRHQVDLKRATLKYFSASVHLSDHEKEGDYVHQLSTLEAEVADLESKLSHLTLRAGGGMMPWHPKPTVAAIPDASTYGTGLHPGQLSFASPVTLEDRHDRPTATYDTPMDFGSGVQIMPSHIDRAQRLAQGQLVRAAEVLEARAFAQRKNGVRLVLEPGTPPGFMLTPTILPWPSNGAFAEGRQPRQLAVVTSLPEGSVEWLAGLRQGMVLTAVASEYLIGPYWLPYTSVVAKVETAIANADVMSEETKKDLDVPAEGVPLFFMLPGQAVDEEEGHAHRSAGAARRQEERTATILAERDVQAKAEYAREQAQQLEAVEKRLAAQREAAAAAAAEERARFMLGGSVTLAEGVVEGVVGGCLRPARQSGAIVTAATVGVVINVDSPWERPQRLRRQIAARQRTVDELTRENLIAPTIPVLEEIASMELELGMSLA